MTCEEALARLDDFEDGQLDEAEFQEVELHLVTCTGCAGQAAELRALVSRAGALPRALAPERDLWPGIAGHIHPHRPIGVGTTWAWTWPALAAAAAIVLVVILWRGNHRPPVSPGAEPAGAAQLASLDIDRDYDRAAAELLAAVSGRRNRLTPEAQARVDESLRIIAQALTAIRSELAKEPGSPALNHLLISVHQRRIEVLRTLAELTA
jgi:anti-sigma factor RsiW